MKLTKKIKRTFCVLLAALMVLSLFCAAEVSVGAASKGNVIYFEKPENWDDTIYIYYWEGSPKPSGLYDYEMEHIGGNIYSYTCKTGFTDFLFNDGASGKHQTVNVKLPSSGKMCRVLSTGYTNEWGNYCNNAEWVDFEQPSIGLSVSASPKSCDFVNSIDVTLSVTETPYGTYKLNGGKAVQYADGTKLTLGADAQVGDVITLELSASADGESAGETYTYTKTATPSASSLAYFDNSSYNWDEVYIYAYGTKENAEWPGVKMQQDESGLYYYAFSAAFKNENVIFNNGREKEDGKEQYPANSGLSLNAGECKLLTSEKEWVSYGTPDSKPAGFAYTASGTAFSSETLNVKIGLKNAVKGTYQIDDGSVFDYTDTTTVSVGQGKIGNSEVKLKLTATSDKGVTTSTVFTYKKTFTPSKTTFSSESDGHTSEAVGGYYGTNPNMQLGKSKTISVDGDPSDWDSSMIIAQGVANDDPRVFMPSAMHEQPWDDYALYAAWDDENLYFMWEMANTTYVVSPSDDFAASQEARPWRNSIPMYLALSINPEIHADGTAWGTDKTGAEYTNPFVWGCVGGTAKDGGVGFKTNVDTLIAFDTNNSNGGSSIFKADHYDEATDNYMFNYDTRIPIGVTSFEKQDNQNGFKIAKDYGTLSTALYGVGGAKGSHTVGDSLDGNSNWVDFFDLGYKKTHGFIYEVAVPLEKLGIDKNYIETKGIGAMHILTYGTSGMDCLPYDASMQDAADVEYSYDPSTSHEKEDVDTITVPLARIGALLSDTVINEAPFEVNFGADKAGTQGVGTSITLKAEAFNGTADYTYDFSINGASVKNSASDSYSWTPSAKGTYTIGVTVTDGKGKTASAEKTITIGDEAPEIIEPTETEPVPTETDPVETGTNPVPSETVTDPVETTTDPVVTETATDPKETSFNPTETVTEPAPSETVTEPVATEPAKKDIGGWTVKGIKNKTYTGKAIKQSVTVTNGAEKAEISVSYKNNKNVGTATVVITGKGGYTGKITKTFKITKAENPMTVSYKKTVSAKSKAKTTIKSAIKVSKAQGAVSYKTDNKKVTVKSGKLIVAKGLKKGKTYKVSVTITAKGNSNYKKLSKKITVKIKTN